MKLKHRLPAFSVIDHLSLDNETLNSLTNITRDLETEFLSVLEANKKLCGVNHDLTQSVYDNFFQISLTESEFNTDDISLEECETSYDSLHKDPLSKSIRQKKILANSDNSYLNENLYNATTDSYNRYSDIFYKILKNFKSKTTRVRLVKLNAGTSIPPHIDYDPSYAVRIILPIISNQDCVNVFWTKGEVISTSFTPGKAYFLNTGYKHAVMNFSKHDRYTFMVSVNGIDDIKHLIND